MSGASSLPDSIVQAIAISNAKSIGEQPAILANLGLANEVLNINMVNQAAITQQSAMNQVALATMAKCVALITQPDEKPDPKTGTTPQSESCIAMLHKIFEEMTKNASGGGDGGGGGTSPQTHGHSPRSGSPISPTAPPSSD